MRLKINWKVLWLIPGFIVTIIGGLVLSQYFMMLRIWQQAGFEGEYQKPEISIEAIKESTRSFSGIGDLILGVGIAIILFCLLFNIVIRFSTKKDVDDEERNLTYSGKGTYGTAGYMTDKEFEQVLELTDPGKTDGTILGLQDGKAVCLPIKSRMNRNIAVYGASGSMKSRAFARNQILQSVKRGESIVITDPKSELYEDCALYLESKGYNVKQFNLVNHANSDSWNVMQEVGSDDISVQMMCDIIIQNTGGGKGDHFWDNSEMNLLKALTLYVQYECAEEDRNLGTVYDLLLSDYRELETLFSALPFTHPAAAPFAIYRQASDTLRGSIVIGLGSRLQVFQNQKIREMTSSSDIDLELPGKQKCAYFCIMSDQSSTFDFLSSLFFAFLFIKLVGYADRECVGCKLPVFVSCILDEFPNIGQIPDFCKKISTVRSRGIGIAVIFQNLAQLQNRYPLNMWQEILGNCDTQLFLGCTDQLTAEYISSRSGEVTIAVSSEAKALSTIRLTDYTPEYRETSSVGKRALLTPDEVLRLPLTTALIFLRGQKVLKVDKFDYTRHPEAKHLKPSKATDHKPERVLREERELAELEARRAKRKKAQTPPDDDTEKKPNPAMQAAAQSTGQPATPPTEPSPSQSVNAKPVQNAKPAVKPQPSQSSEQTTKSAATQRPTKPQTQEQKAPAQKAPEQNAPKQRTAERDPQGTKTVQQKAEGKKPKKDEIKNAPQEQDKLVPKIGDYYPTPNTEDLLQAAAIKRPPRRHVQPKQKSPVADPHVAEAPAAEIVAISNDSGQNITVNTKTGEVHETQKGTPLSQPETEDDDTEPAVEPVVHETTESEWSPQSPEPDIPDDNSSENYEEDEDQQELTEDEELGIAEVDVDDLI